MRAVILAITVLFSSSLWAADVTPYAEWKNVQAWKDSNHTGQINHLRLGAQVSKFYAEAGVARTDEGEQGFSGEVGYKWKFNERVTLKGKWEGVDLKDTLGHKLETELRVTF